MTFTKNVVLFGAGASHGCGKVVPNTAPLGNELYDRLRSRFPNRWGKITSRCAPLFQNNFEKGMQALYETGDPQVQELMCDMALFFSEFQASDNSNLYIQLLSKVKPLLDNTIFSSLNYDLLFEDALCGFGYKPDYFVENSEGITFLKLHGSCNFLPEGGIVKNNIIIGSSGISFPLKGASREEVAQFCSIKGTIYPVMALYMDSKPKQISSDRINDIQKRWTDHILSAERILIVGVRPYPADTHVWGPLLKTNARIGYIGSDYFHCWHKENRNNKKDCFIGTRWENHFDESVQFLKS